MSDRTGTISASAAIVNAVMSSATLSTGFPKPPVDADESVRVAGTIIGWSLHQSDGTLDAKLEGLTVLMRDIRGLLLKNHGARRERD